jgi:lysophospholipase L1-like esterase
MSPTSQSLHDRLGAPRRRALPNAIGKSLLLAFSLLICLVAAELATRLVYPQFLGKWGERADFYAYDSIRGWRGRADVEARFQRMDFSVMVRQNRYGYRGWDCAVEKAKGRRRMLVLGDSYAWGYGVEDDKMFTSILDDRLPAMDVLNLGCSGYGTDQELLTLETDGLRFDPDVIVVVVTLPSDFENNTHAVQYDYPKPYFIFRGNTLVRRNVPVPHRNGWQRFSCWMTRRSTFYNYIRARRIPLPFGIDETRADCETDAVRITAALLEEIDGLGRTHGSEVLIVLNPTIAAKTYGLYQGDKVGRLDDALTQTGLWVVNLSPVFSDHVRAGGDRLVFEHDSHWNAAGHRLVASAIELALREGPRGDLPSRK